MSRVSHTPSTETRRFSEAAPIGSLGRTGANDTPQEAVATARQAKVILIRPNLTRPRRTGLPRGYFFLAGAAAVGGVVGAAGAGGVVGVVGAAAGAAGAGAAGAAPA